MNTFPRPLLAVLVLAVLSLLAGGTWFYRTQKQHVQQSAEEELQAVAHLKARQIADWRADQLAEGGELMASAFFSNGVARWLATPRPEDAEDLLSRFRSLQAHYNYQDVLLLDPEGSARLSLSGRLDPPHAAVAQALAIALRDRKPAITDLHADAGQTPHLALIAPLFAGNGAAAKSIGAVVLVIDARRFLYPLIQSWPSPSETAETLLVRRDGDSVLFLNELRHQANTALKLRLPLSQADMPAAMAVLGRQGVVHGRDYRGVEVLAVLDAVPDSPWFMVAKVDVAETFAAWRFRSLLILALLASGMALVVASVFVVWQRNQKSHFRMLYQAEAAMRRSKERHGITLKSIGDAVIATDAQGRVDLLNPVAEALTDWKQEEACGKPLEDVFRIINEHTRLPVENPVHRVLREGVVVGLANHTLLVARDGTERPIADSGAPICDEQNQVFGVVLVFRDQTEERARQRALRESEDRFREMAEIIQEVFWMSTPDLSRMLYLSPAFETIWGHPCQSVFENPLAWVDAIHRDDRDRVLAALEERAGGKYNIEYRIMRPDGEVRWIYDHGFPVRDDAGKIVRMVGIAADITERKRAEEALRLDSQMMFNMADGVYLVRAKDGIIVHANPQFEKMFGYDPGELIGKHVSIVNAPSDKTPQETAKEITDVLNKKGERFGEILNQKKDGTHFWCRAAVTTFEHSEHGTVWVSTHQDITERKRAMETLETSERRFQDIADHALEWIWEVDAEGKYTYASQMIEKILGYTPEEILQKHFYDLFHPEEREAFKAAALAAFATKQPFREFINRNVHKNGQTVWLATSGLPLLDDKGNLLGYRGVDTDITERKRAEADLKRHAEELERFNRLAVGRELRVIELKQEVNDLASRLGQPRPYPLAFMDAAAEAVVRTTPKPSDQKAE